MAKQMLIYDRVVAVSPTAHADVSIAGGHGYRFAGTINAVPLLAAEFLSASAEYAIVFAGDGDAVVPSVVLGIRRGQNAFLRDEGGWDADYVPAFLRRYPFVFARAQTAEGQQDRMTLCFDEAFDGINREGRGERLFDSQGNRTQYLENTLRFVTEFQQQFDATRRLCAGLKDLELFEPAQAQFTLGDGQKAALSGFLRINREKLKALPDDTILQLFRSQALELIHAHLHSLRNIRTMARRLVGPDGSIDLGNLKDADGPADLPAEGIAAGGMATNGATGQH
ncbi:MAG: SapC family protein [Pseudomonadota bacterium]